MRMPDFAQCFKYADKMLLLVSRTFALNINVLTGNLRKTVLLAYLYLRIADTIEDDPELSVEEKCRLLGLFSKIFEPGADVDLNTSEFVHNLPLRYKESSDPNCDLCLHAETIVPLLWHFDPCYYGPVAATVVEMCEGMSHSVVEMGKSTATGWFTLQTPSELNRYCYYVAGIVGKLLSDLFSAKNSLISEERLKKMKTLDVSFGLALQLVNIIKDVREDSERKVCFVPEMICHRHGIEHSPDMFASGVSEKARASIMKELVGEAWKHLSDAVEYTVTIPRLNPRIRLFCLWPLFMAAENLVAMGDCSALFSKEKKVKITRDDVKRIVRTTMFHFYSDSWIKSRFEQLRTSL
ncbi:MAG: squalene/phytoene synthase family protein [Fibrobacteraceae bacterium]|nr:squalene/phytoene synthase family protein [Fibrobacteraceae bacterium]